MTTRQTESPSVILTPTPRLARAEKRRLSEARLAEGATAYGTPAEEKFFGKMSTLVSTRPMKLINLAG